MFRDYLTIVVGRDGMRARSAIMGNKPLVPLYMIKQLGLLEKDLRKYYRDSIPKSHMYEFLEDINDDKTRKELRKLLDKVYK